MKLIIIGAGASAYCDIANPNRRPPLVKLEDFIRIIKDPIPGSVLTSRDGPLGIIPYMEWSIKQFNGDIEKIFSIIYLLSFIPDKMPKDKGEIANYFSLINDEDLINSLDETIEYFKHHNLFFYPDIRLGALNFLSTFYGALRTEIIACFGTKENCPQPLEYMPLSNEHRKIARTLNPGDVVISFNYDNVMDYALLNEAKLNEKSFINSHFTKIIIHTDLCCKTDPVILLKPHGSFNWTSDELHKKILITFGKAEIPNDYAFGTPIILPFKAKEFFLRTNKLFSEELSNSLDYIKKSDEIVLIGKQFYNGDSDLAQMIQNCCKEKQRKMLYIDPCTKNQDWVNFHDQIFNARNHDDPKRYYGSLQQYVYDLR